MGNSGCYPLGRLAEVLIISCCNMFSLTGFDVLLYVPLSCTLWHLDLLWMNFVPGKIFELNKNKKETLDLIFPWIIWK